MRTLFTGLALFLFTSGQLFGQGALSPGAGPAPVMRSLDQIEPRILIHELPYTITESGAYALAGPLQASGTGITVAAHRVTLDLQGFQISGVGSGTGIEVQDVSGVSIRNGILDNFGIGVQMTNASAGRLEHLTVSNSASQGILIAAQDGDSLGNQLRNLSLQNSGGPGLGLEAGENGRVIGNIIMQVQISDSGSNGLRLRAAGGEVSGNLIRNTRVSGTANFSGVDLLSDSGGRVQGNLMEQLQVTQNSHSGLRMMAFGADTITTGNVLRNSTITGNGNQIPALSVQGLSGGAANGNLIEGSKISQNAQSGINFNQTGSGSTRGNLVRNSQISDNAGTGISLDPGVQGTRIQDNQISGHATGISAGSTGSLVFRNVFFNHSGNAITQISADNIIAPTPTAVGTIPTSTNAWSNFSF